MSGNKTLRRTALLLTAMAVLAVLVPTALAADAPTPTLASPLS